MKFISIILLLSTTVLISCGGDNKKSNDRNYQGLWLDEEYIEDIEAGDFREVCSQGVVSVEAIKISEDNRMFFMETNDGVNLYPLVDGIGFKISNNQAVFPDAYYRGMEIFRENFSRSCRSRLIGLESSYEEVEFIKLAPGDSADSVVFSTRVIDKTCVNGRVESEVFDEESIGIKVSPEELKLLIEQVNCI